jgi:preprotein translocase subunit SecG
LWPSGKDEGKDEKLMHGFLQALLMLVLMLTALFLIVLVLIQRGKGGGLAGAFGGMGGQSAFGAKAGDLFTRITIGVAAFWIILCMITVKYMGSKSGLIERDRGGEAASSLPLSESEASGGAADGGGGGGEAAGPAANQ